MKQASLCQGLKSVLAVFVCAVFLSGCMASNPYSSPWSIPYPTNSQSKQQQNQATHRPDIDWQTAAKRRSLEVYYDQEQATTTEEQRRRIYIEKQRAEQAQNGGYQRPGQRFSNRQISSEVLKPPAGQAQNQIEAEPLPPKFKKKTGEITVALLLPTSGQYSKLGKSMMQAAQMALFDLDSKSFRLLPKDTKGTAEGAHIAAREAVAEGADLILGPVFSDSVRSAQIAVGHSNVPMVAYTTDWKVAGRNTYIMGFLPFSQVIRVVNYARHKGYQNTAFFGPSNDYSNIVMRTLHYSLRQQGGYIAKTGHFSIAQPDLHTIVKDFIGEVVDGKKSSVVPDDAVLQFDSVMVPVGGQALKSVANMFSYYNVDQKRVRFLGTGLWDDVNLSREQMLNGAWFAAPDPNLRRDFETRYQNNFGAAPERLATLAYDSMALAIVLAKTHNGYGEPYSRERLVTEQGFAGIDGIFRFRRDNLVERGLAVLEVKNDGLKVIDPAPKAFFIQNN